MRERTQVSKVPLAVEEKDDPFNVQTRERSGVIKKLKHEEEKEATTCEVDLTDDREDMFAHLERQHQEDEEDRFANLQQ